MDLGLDGARAIITGASRGVGRAIAEELLAEGASVAICARGTAGRSADTGSAVVCKWSDPTSERAAAVKLFRLDRAVGECFDRPESPDVTSVPAVPCREPHDLEVFAVLELGAVERAFPGPSAVARQA